jgi:hypothetical protein
MQIQMRPELTLPDVAVFAVYLLFFMSPLFFLWLSVYRWRTDRPTAAFISVVATMLTGAALGALGGVVDVTYGSNLDQLDWQYAARQGAFALACISFVYALIVAVIFGSLVAVAEVFSSNRA